MASQQQPQHFELRHISRRGFTVAPGSNGTFPNELLSLSTQIRIADALEFIGGKLAGQEKRVSDLEKQVRSLKTALSALRKEVRNG